MSENTSPETPYPPEISSRYFRARDEFAHMAKHPEELTIDIIKEYLSASIALDEMPRARRSEEEKRDLAELKKELSELNGQDPAPNPSPFWDRSLRKELEKIHRDTADLNRMLASQGECDPTYFAYRSESLGSAANFANMFLQGRELVRQTKAQLVKKIN